MCRATAAPAIRRFTAVPSAGVALQECVQLMKLVRAAAHGADDDFSPEAVDRLVGSEAPELQLGRGRATGPNRRALAHAA